MATHSYREFLRWVALVTFLSALCVLLITIVIDPYAVIGTPRIAGLNAIKHDSKNDRLLKAAAIRQVAYDGVILGTSQAQFGLDPSSEGIRPMASRFYNLGLVAATPYELRRYLEGANHQGQVRAVVLLLDTLMFNEKIERNANGFGFAEGRLPIGPDGKGQLVLSRFWDLPQTTFTLDALKLSLKTATRQSPESEWLRPDGLHASMHIKHDLWREAGPRKAFLESEKRYMDWFDGFTLTPRHKGQTALKDLDNLLDYCADRDIAVRILISPAHARYFQLLGELGFMDDVEQFKRNLVDLLWRHRVKRSKVGPEAVRPLPVWDFSSASEITSEEVPPSSKKGSEMRWYFDTVHFTPELGELILGESAGPFETTERQYAEILTPETLDAALVRIRRTHENYAQTHPDDLAEIRRLVSDAKKSRPIAQRVSPRRGANVGLVTDATPLH